MISLEAFCCDPHTALASGSIHEVVHRQKVVAYLLSPDHYHGLLRSAGNPNAPATKAPDLTQPVPLGKFAIFPHWSPGEDFEKQAAIWGIAINPPVSDSELAAFISYWQAEGKMFHHAQWQQKLARSIQVSRGMSAVKTGGKRDIALVSTPDQSVPDGFRG